MVYFGGWLAAVLAGVVVPVQDVEPYPFPAWNVVALCCLLPGGEFVCFAVVACGVCYFCAADLVADLMCAGHVLLRLGEGATVLAVAFTTWALRCCWSLWCWGCYGFVSHNLFLSFGKVLL